MCKRSPRKQKLKRGSSYCEGEISEQAQRINHRTKTLKARLQRVVPTTRGDELVKVRSAGGWGKPLKRNLVRGSGAKQTHTVLGGERRRECEKHCGRNIDGHGNARWQVDSYTLVAKENETPGRCSSSEGGDRSKQDGTLKRRISSGEEVSVPL